MTEKYTPSSKPNVGEAALVIGNFDGVHRGHQALVSHTVELAGERGLRPLVMTFEPHPAVALGGTMPPLLTTLARKVELLRALAPNIEVVIEHFDRTFAQLLPEQFVERILAGGLRLRELVVGHNFRFGRDRLGTVQTLEALGRTRGFSAHAFALSGDGQGAFSSTRIRHLIKEGDLDAAHQLLGRPHAVTGTVVKGDGRGRTIGIPTANLDAVEELRPLEGVYACRVELIAGEGSRDLGAAVANLGPRPTVERGDAVEVHLLDRHLDLYGQQLRVMFLKRLREQRRFEDLDGLKRQIAQDIDEARRVLGAAAP